MAHKVRGLTALEAKEVVRLYQIRVGNKRKYTQGELASKFFVSAVTVRRALADAGLVVLASHKTPEETEMLEYLYSISITSLDSLKEAFND